MPDNQPPSGWGPASSDDRDLDAVLAGQMADIPIALHPVADVLAALRASPAPAELRGQANVLAEFRAHGPGGVARPMEPAPTRPLSVLPADRPSRRRPARRHRRPQAVRPVSHWAGVLTGVAAAVAIVIVVAFTGNLPGPIERLAHLGPTVKASATSASSHSPAPRTETSSASERPTTPPPSTHSTGQAQSEGSTTCREYYGDFTHPDPPSRLATEISLWRQLTELAGSQSPVQVYRYCEPWVAGMFPRWAPELKPYPATPHADAGSQGSSQQGPQDSATPQNSPAAPSIPAAQNTRKAQNGLQGSQPASSNGVSH